MCAMTRVAAPPAIEPNPLATVAIGGSGALWFVGLAEVVAAGLAVRDAKRDGREICSGTRGRRSGRLDNGTTEGLQ